MKVVQLHEQTPKQLSNPTPTPKTADYGPKQTKMTQKSSQLKCQNSGNPMKAQFLPLFNVNLSQHKLKSTST